jgi:hypothetical protein
LGKDCGTKCPEAELLKMYLLERFYCAAVVGSPETVPSVPALPGPPAKLIPTPPEVPASYYCPPSDDELFIEAKNILMSLVWLVEAVL